MKCQPLYSRTFSLLSSIVMLLLPLSTELWGRGEEEGGGGGGGGGEREEEGSKMMKRKGEGERIEGEGGRRE